MSNYISDNDDDLFDYDPEKDSSNKNISSSQTSSESSDTNDLLNQIKNHLNRDGNDFNTHNSKLAIGFANSTYHFISSIANEALVKSLVMTLDSLTNGDFSLLIRFNQLEMKISKRMDFHLIVKEIFFNNQAPSEALSELFDFLNIECTPTYISTCFLSSIAISNHALMIDRAEYLVLSEKLNIPAKTYLLESTAENEQIDHQVNLISFMNSIQKTMCQSLSPSIISQLKTLHNLDAEYKNL